LLGGSQDYLSWFFIVARRGLSGLTLRQRPKKSEPFY
jgi:hypothetical protein